MFLPLLSVGGGEAYHDWNYLSTHLRMLRWNLSIGSLTRGVGEVCLIVAVLSGTWLIWKMYSLRRG